MTNHDEEFDALQLVATKLIIAYRRGAHDGSIDWTLLDDAHHLACQVLGKRTVEIIHHEVDGVLGL